MKQDQARLDELDRYLIRRANGALKRGNCTCHDVTVMFDPNAKVTAMHIEHPDADCPMA